MFNCTEYVQQYVQNMVNSYMPCSIYVQKYAQQYGHMFNWTEMCSIVQNSFNNMFGICVEQRCVE